MFGAACGVVMKLRIFDKINNYKKSDPLRLHMPGHKGKAKLFGGAESFDITEVEDLKIEQEVAKAETDLAKVYGVRHLKMLTGGSTVGVLAMMAAAKKYGDKIVILRQSHKSVFNALNLFGLEPIIVGGESFDGLYEFPDEDCIIKAAGDKSVSGVLLTYPDYYGRVFDVKSIYKRLKQAGKKLFLDAAHGAHLPFCGAGEFIGFCDACVMSTHKTLCSLNSGALLIANDELEKEVFSAADVLSTTSPSYLILSSAEYGVKRAAACKKTNGKKAAALEGLKAMLKNLGFTVIKNDDPFKIAIDFEASGISAKKAAKELEKQGVFFELNDNKRILFMFSFETSAADIERFYRAIKNTAALKKNIKTEADIRPLKGATVKVATSEKRERVVSYLVAVNSNKQETPLKMAEGKICAENFGTFPPCYPVCIAGERITRSDIEQIKKKSAFGVYNGKVLTVNDNEG